MELDQRYIEDCFIKYAKVDTRSDVSSKQVPTTTGQKKLALIVCDDLKKLGVEAWYNEKTAFTIARIPSNTEKNLSSIGFIAHLDTADFNSENVCPIVHPDYDGGDVVLNEDLGIVLSSKEFPDLKKFKGQRLITTDGTTLLGADDKAGVAGLLGAVKYLKEHPDFEHGALYLAFGPDEEIGQGAKRFDETEFPVEFAYTLDNGQPGEIEYETFNAAWAQIEVEGTAVHPGDAYGLMVNVALIANEIVSALPQDEVPEKSKDHEGFILVNEFDATVDHAYLSMIIRDFDTEKFFAKQEFLKELVSKINARYDKPRVTLKFTEQYRNIGDTIKKNPYIVNLAIDSYKKLGFEVKIVPFRGGTDGNFFTQKGIPTPNLFNGGNNFHGQYEYVTTEAMATVSKTILTIVEEHVLQSQSRNMTPLP